MRICVCVCVFVCICVCVYGCFFQWNVGECMYERLDVSFDCVLSHKFITHSNVLNTTIYYTLFENKKKILKKGGYIYNCGFVPTVLNRSLNVMSIRDELQHLTVNFGKERCGVTGCLVSKV